MAGMPDVPHVAVFDTAFHHSIPRHAYLYALPYSLYEDHHVRRYGFHGTSHAFVAKSAARLLGRPLEELRLVILHLGNGNYYGLDTIGTGSTIAMGRSWRMEAP